MTPNENTLEYPGPLATIRFTHNSTILLRHWFFLLQFLFYNYVGTIEGKKFVFSNSKSGHLCVALNEWKYGEKKLSLVLGAFERQCMVKWADWTLTYTAGSHNKQ